MASVEMLPWPIAAEFALLGEQVSAERLLACGALNAVVPEPELMGRSPAVGREVRTAPAASPGHQGADACYARPACADIQAKERLIRNQLAELADSKEAVSAWVEKVEKRPPVFRGA